MDFELTPEQQDHVIEIQREFCVSMREKYTRGAQEHGGDLRDMPILQLVDNSISEAIDQVTYLLTLKQKLLKLIENEAVPPLRTFVPPRPLL